MAERMKSKGPKGNEGEEGTDDSKQKGGGGEKDHQQKRARLGGAAHFVHKRMTRQPKSTPKKKSFDSPAPPPPRPFVVQEMSQQHLESAWVISWQDTTQAPVPSVETLPSTEGATPPTPMRYDHDDEDDDDVSVFAVADCIVATCN
uniref:Uncharacterized protein n=1 Tax=Amphimedon queenslandica TaxID=400682 RepID=A0A1X7SYF4_AMPQE